MKEEELNALKIEFRGLQSAYQNIVELETCHFI
jgi:hypothetical protein